MRLVIHKFEFEVNDHVEIDMQMSVKVLEVGTQRPNHICVWAAVREEDKKTKVRFEVRGTGHRVTGEEVGKHLGTVFDGEFVWHVFGPFVDSGVYR